MDTWLINALKRQLHYSTIVLRMHAEVDNEEGSTIRLYTSMPYNLIMHNLHNIKTTKQIITR